MKPIWLRCNNCTNFPNQRVNREFTLKDVEIEKTGEKYRSGWLPDGEPAQVKVTTYRIDITLEGSCKHEKRITLFHREEE